MSHYQLINTKTSNAEVFTDLIPLTKQLETAQDIDAYTVEIEGKTYQARRWLKLMLEWHGLRPEFAALGLEWQQRALDFIAANYDGVHG